MRRRKSFDIGGWIVKGDEILWQRERQEWKLSLKVNPTKTPKEIDLTYLSGPFKGETCQGMYKWGTAGGKSLQISIQDPGATVARPTSISMKGSGKTSLMFLNGIDNDYMPSSSFREPGPFKRNPTRGRNLPERRPSSGGS